MMINHQLCIFSLVLLLSQVCLQLPLHVYGTARSLVATEGRALQSTSSGLVFSEYIGGGGAALSDVPIDRSVEFHFLLAFAIDQPLKSSSPARSTNGNFSTFWQPRISPTNVQAIKANYSNVKFGVSVGGGGTTPIFSPTNVSSWVNNAVASLAQIIQDYSLDGIDIDYEIFAADTLDSFSVCIGELITELKNRKLISFASIAPYPATNSYYTRLWNNYSSVIDYVNYQFYSGGNISVNDYVNLYQEVKGMYAGGKVIPSFETVNNGTVIIPSSGLQGCQSIQAGGDLQGIFIWSADQSYKNFQFERRAQELLASS